MSQAAKVQEPSMEEILASIRRIISDDDVGKPSAKGAEPVVSPPLPAPHQAAAQAPAEPESQAMSQDDIDAMLASFDAAGGAADPEPAAAEPPEEAEVLDLTEAMEVRAPHAASPRQTETEADIVFADAPRRAPPPDEPPRIQAAPAVVREAAEPHSLLSDQATAAVTSAFGSLAHTVLIQNARTLDDLVREMLRPMLKSWLDDNLPTIVERLVRAEIERVSRGQG